MKQKLLLIISWALGIASFAAINTVLELPIKMLGIPTYIDFGETITINHRYYDEEVDGAFTAVGRRNKFDATIKVVGGGIKSQLEAVSHGLSRALNKYDPEAFHKILRKNELLTRDSRMKESRKYGLMGARKKKASPKR